MNICINAKKSILLTISMSLYKAPRYFTISSLKWILKKAGGLKTHLHVKNIQILPSDLTSEKMVLIESQ